ncbi:hypothetical protein HK097_002446 [Rhizophlyctis rosea]|uniref:STEEP1 domain-containing protein n=1 Tax=Rhizophlyctis rosea TaxID=64517 RepID=A0AAD5X0N5_9FUNG|nr:hypothetical protein HK097_002446 [Rhizophlyctis rosea]
MPKIVSSTTVSASTDEPQKDSQKLHTYYCLYCGEFVLIIDKHLRKLPRRKTDNAYIIDRTKHTSKLHLATGPTRFVRRDNLYEKQHRYHCPKCALPVAYDQEGQYLYILDKAAHYSVAGDDKNAGSGSGDREVMREGRVADKRPAGDQMSAEQLLREVAESL